MSNVEFRSGPSPDLFFGAAMSVGRVVRHFQGSGKVPISISDVLQVVSAMAPDEHIEVWGVDVDPAIFKGNCFRFRKPAMPGSLLTHTRHAVITYSSRMPLCEQRLVVCKELIHILDSDPILTDTAEKVIALADRMLVSTPITGLGADDVSAFLDKMARWQALAILFPYALWEDVMPKFKEGKVTIVQISDWLQLPESYVAIVMTDAWASIREAVLSFA